MRSKVKKALCCAAAVAAAAGIAAISGCSDYYKADSLGEDSYKTVTSNGGFAVETDNYIYFINGVESNDADNTYGDVEKGAILRISIADYNAGNYTNVDTVVPLIAYSGSYESGIYIYGDYIYYTTPSTDRDGSGEILNSQLEFKRTKLDGTETMKDCYINIENSSVEYRYVSDGTDVYLLYVVSESIFDDVSSTAYNIHSLQLTGSNAGTNTLLAYDVDEYVFDTSNLESPYIYYTMDVTYNLGTGYDGETTDYSTTANYNQVYKVCAYDSDDLPWTAEDKYDFSYVVDADGDYCYDYDANPLYVNRGTLIFDGIGALCDVTQFNYEWDSSKNSAGDSITYSSINANSLSGYNYSLTGYSDGNLYYTRSYYSSDDSSTPIWFYLSDSEITSSWDAVNENPVVLNDSKEVDSHTLLLDGSDISGYTVYTKSATDSTPTYVLYMESVTSGYAMMWATLANGKIDTSNNNTCFPMTTTDSDVTYLTTSEETTADGKDLTYLYYSVSDEGNSYSVHRIALYGSYDDYVKLPASEEDGSNYSDIQILDLDCAGWYAPEILEGQFMFASSTDDMTNYNYIMVFDLRVSTWKGTTAANDVTISNYDIKAINELHEDVIAEIDDTDSDEYENLLNALYYVFYTRDSGYLEELVQLWVDEGEDVEYKYSKESQQMYLDFYNAVEDYADYGASADWSKKTYSDIVKSKTFTNADGEEETVYATSRAYFYTLIGYMSEDDEEDYIDEMRTTYMIAEPEEVSWWDGLETWVKVIFIVGVSLGGLLIIAAAVLIPIFVIRKKHKKLPSYSKARIKVDTTDDMDIDVYSDDGGAEDGATDSGTTDSGADE